MLEYGGFNLIYELNIGIANSLKINIKANY